MQNYSFLVGVLNFRLQDGNGFSGRFIRLLSSGSLIFKASQWSDFHNYDIRPFEHFIPIAFDYSDLREKLNWAQDPANVSQIRTIVEQAKIAVEKYASARQIQCDLALKVIELAAIENR